MTVISTDRARSYGKVVVLMGGHSAEREISLRSGGAVLRALQDAGIDAHGQDTAAANFPAVLERERYSRAFIALHGRGGEDGVLQGLLETLGIPYTGSGVLGSALAMDKLRTKQVWRGAGIPTPGWHVLADAGAMEAARDSLQYPLIVKPAHEGSSIGISRVDSAAALTAAWRQAARYDAVVIAEQWVAGPEYTAGVLGGGVLPLIRLETPNVFYDYEAKYAAESTRYLIPCGLDAAREAELQTLSLAAFHAVGASGWGRVDFMLDAAGRPWFIEVNTVPGLTDHSLVPMAAAASGTDFIRLACRILDTSLEAAAAAAEEGSRAKA
ncbi:MAG: D-alanine--D-alanine ligase [Gammaproteobacteria bacterium]|jgi:D-alanine-D-alanine ligase